MFGRYRRCGEAGAAAMRRARAAVAAVLVLAGVLALPRCALAGLFDMSEKEEIKIGRKTAKMLAERYGVVDEPAQVERLEYIGSAIVAVCERQDIEYHFEILDTDAANALAIPGGYIFITRGLLEMVDDDDELASVVAHEVVHIARKHSVVGYKKSMKSMMYSLILVLLSQDPGVMMASSMYSQAKMQTFGRKAEVEADRVGLYYMTLAGYNPVGFLRFLDRMRIAEGRRPNLLEDYFEEHMPTPERIAMVEGEVRDMGIDPAEDRGYKIRARVIAEEVCNEGEFRCAGALRGGDMELVRLAERSVFPSAYDRALEVEARLNGLLGGGLEMYGLRVHESGGHVTIWGDKKMIVEVLSGDVEAAGAKSRSQLARQWVSNLRQFLWSDFVRERL